jgi:hypothetical protein
LRLKRNDPRHIERSGIDDPCARGTCVGNDELVAVIGEHDLVGRLGNRPFACNVMSVGQIEYFNRTVDFCRDIKPMALQIGRKMIEVAACYIGQRCSRLQCERRGRWRCCYGQRREEYACKTSNR